MKRNDKATIGAVIIVSLILVFYYFSKFVVLHPYWSFLIGVLIIGVIAIIVKKSVDNPELIENEKTIFSFVFDAFKALFTQSGKESTERGPRKKLSDDVKNKIFNNAADKCQICGEKVGLNIHHIDGNRTNDKLNNLILLCANDHNLADRGVISKFRLKNAINEQKTTGYISVSRPK